MTVSLACKTATKTKFANYFNILSLVFKRQMRFSAILVIKFTEILLYKY